MPDINSICIAGRLTRDPELKYLQNGTACCKLGLAATRMFKNSDGSKGEETLFINITAWRKLAEYCGETYKKGAPIYVEGRLKSDSWEDKATGQKRTNIEVQADRIQGLAWADRDGRNSAQEGDSDDVPF
jgi:single-strand DNA-binding protein